MEIPNITDRNAVLKAIVEFDRIGCEPFLEKYGFGPSRGWLLVESGRKYDAKAILGAAHGYQFPRQGPLPATEFHGGAPTARKLRALGFQVEEPGSATPGTTQSDASGYWIFVCNPRRWAIDRFLAEGIEHDTWGVRPSDSAGFAPGQLAMVRVGVDRRNKEERAGHPKLESGIYAICKVESEAYPGRGAADRFWAPGMARAEGWPTVKIRYLRTYAERPLTVARLKAERPDLSPLLLRGLEASSFPIGETDFYAVLDLLGEDSEMLPSPPAPSAVTFDELASLEQRYQHATPQEKERIARTIERGSIGAWIKHHNEFRCQICEALGRDPIGFRKPNGEPYVEAHHVTPVAQRQVGTLGAANVITVCANHHRQLHYGGVGVEIGEEVFRFTLPEGSVEIPRLRVPAAAGAAPQGSRRRSRQQ